jgi:3-dehydroquinate synthase
MPEPEPATRFPVTHPHGSYEVLVGTGLLADLARHLPTTNSRVALITDSNVGPLYAHHVGVPDPLIITVPAGEAHKTLDTVRTIYDQLLAAQCDRHTAVVALGGGVINDMAGFVAATFLRGVTFITCPTSLLAMVDASVGGKTGVDLPQGKNLIGAFKQPAAVIADIDTLATLPPVERAAGMAEVIKHGLLNDPSLLTADPDNLTQLVARAIQVKRDVVQADPYELTGQRALLNLGHTFGHAIEQVSQYAISHGYAVGMGLVCAAHLSARLGYAPPELQTDIEGWLQAAQLPTRLPAALPPEALWQAMGSDKKRAEGRVRFVLLRGVGQAFLADGVPATAVLDTLRALRA